jgi:hypothetical protein
MVLKSTLINRSRAPICSATPPSSPIEERLRFCAWIQESFWILERVPRRLDLRFDRHPQEAAIMAWRRFVKLKLKLVKLVRRNVSNPVELAEREIVETTWCIGTGGSGTGAVATRR